MVKERKLYYRRKEKSLIIEGKQDGRSVLIWTLPSPEKLISELIEKSSYFTQEKAEKIKEKLSRLDYKGSNVSEDLQEVPTTEISRTPQNDDKKKELTEEEKKILWELSQ